MCDQQNNLSWHHNNQDIISEISMGLFQKTCCLSTTYKYKLCWKGALTPGGSYFINVKKNKIVQRNLREGILNILSTVVQGLVDFVWFGLWCLMPLSTIFQLYSGRNWSSQWKPPTCCKQL